MSRVFIKPETQYAAQKLEFLALKWSMSGPFCEYLYGNTFQVKFDNNPLSYALTITRLDATGHPWVAQLALYNFGIKYKAGNMNIKADALYLIDWNCEISMEEVKAILDAAKGHPQAMVKRWMVLACQDMSVTDWAQAQQNDTKLR